MQLPTGAYPQFVGRSDHKPVIVDFEPPSFESEGLKLRFYSGKDILQDLEALEDLGTQLESIKATRDSRWEDVLSCIPLAAVARRKEHRPKHKMVEYRALQLL